MKSYNTVERKIAKSLDSFPIVRKIARKTYQYINYLRFREKGFVYNTNNHVSISPIKGNGETFFGYYDKSPWNKEMNLYLYHEIILDRVKINLLDLQTQEVREIGTSSAWNYQQGSMAQWISPYDRIIYNDIVDGELVSKIYFLKEQNTKIYPFPVQSVHPEGGSYLALNYRRLDKLRPEYGYSKEVSNFSMDMSYDEDGIWKVDLSNQKVELMIPLEKLINNDNDERMSAAKHKVNHIIYSPDGKHFLFMHRWFGTAGKFSRLYVSDDHGENLKILLDDRMVSHYQWIDNEHIVVWGRKEEIGDRYFVINIASGSISCLNEPKIHGYGDGHPSVSPDKTWMITDTYPDKGRQRHLILYNLRTNQMKVVGKFFSPWKYDEEKRADLHPRWSPNGKMISIDSTHEGIRQNYILDISKLVSKSK